MRTGTFLEITVSYPARNWWDRGGKKWLNIFITLSSDDKMSTPNILTHQMKVNTIGMTLICVAYCLTKNLSFVIQLPAFHFPIYSIPYGLASVFHSFSGSIIPLHFVSCSHNILVAKPKLVVRAGSYIKSSCKCISILSPLCMHSYDS